MVICSGLNLFQLLKAWMTLGNVGNVGNIGNLGNMVKAKSSLTQGQEFDLERIQKVALRIILDENYISYTNALHLTGLKTLKQRRSDLSLNFAKKCVTNEETKSMFPLRPQARQTRNPEKYVVTTAHTSRLAKSAIPSMQRQLNKC